MGRYLELVESPLTARASGLCSENQLAEKSQVGVGWARLHEAGFGGLTAMDGS